MSGKENYPANQLQKGPTSNFTIHNNQTTPEASSLGLGIQQSMSPLLASEPRAGDGAERQGKGNISAGPLIVATAVDLWNINSNERTNCEISIATRGLLS
jgi:hypothetical protein